MPAKKFADHYDSRHNPLRHGTYTDKPVRCPNTKSFGYDKTEASRGDIIRYSLEGIGGEPIYRIGRVVGRVDASAMKGSSPEYDAPEIRGFLAVLELDMFDAAYLRWIDPKDVTRIRSCPTEFPAWFFQKELPEFEEVLKLNRMGALSESYIAKYSEKLKREEERNG